MVFRVAFCAQSSRLPAAGAAQAQTPLQRYAWCCRAAGPTTCPKAHLVGHACLRLIRHVRLILRTSPRQSPWARLSQRLPRLTQQGAWAAHSGVLQGQGQGLAASRACQMQLWAGRRSRQRWQRQRALARGRNLVRRLPCALLQARQRRPCPRRHLLLRQLSRQALGRFCWAHAACHARLRQRGLPGAAQRLRRPLHRWVMGSQRRAWILCSMRLQQGGP